MADHPRPRARSAAGRHAGQSLPRLDRRRSGVPGRAGAGAGRRCRRQGTPAGDGAAGRHGGAAGERGRGRAGHGAGPVTRGRWSTSTVSRMCRFVSPRGGQPAGRSPSAGARGRCGRAGYAASGRCRHSTPGGNRIRPRCRSAARRLAPGATVDQARTMAAGAANTPSALRRWGSRGWLLLGTLRSWWWW